MNRKILWNNKLEESINRRSVHTISWDKLCRQNVKEVPNQESRKHQYSFLSKGGWKIVIQSENI